MATSVLIAPQLFESLGKLTANDQARAIDFIKTFQSNPASPGVSLERITKTRSKNLWSGRVTRDLRAIHHKDGDTWAILHADHHDGAYNWAERRLVGRHSVTGALQIVESVETVREVERVMEVAVQPKSEPVFGGHEDDYLISLGVPEEWLPTLKMVRNDDQLLNVCEKLSEDTAERLLALAAGEFVTPPVPVGIDRPAIEAPDTRRRFYVAEDEAGLVAALEAPLDRWIGFLHPTQRALVERSFTGPAKVSGSAGTGKTVVAMHRARLLARRGEKVLLTSYVTTLCENIERNLAKLCNRSELENITVSTVHKQALALVREIDPRIRPASQDEVRSVLDHHCLRQAPQHDRGFVQAEWDNVVRLQGLSTWDEYRSARRTGRGRGLSVRERKALWTVFGGTLEDLECRGLIDWPGLCIRARELLDQGAVKSRYSEVIVDEVQDLRPPELQFLRVLSATHPGNLMLCGDTGQRIYAGGSSLRALGIEVRGRSVILRVNYRTTEQIRRLADSMLGDHSDDMDGGQETRTGTRSLLRGPRPTLSEYPDPESERIAAAKQVQAWSASGLALEAIAVFARTGKVLDGVGRALAEAGLGSRRLSEKEEPRSGEVSLGTMHRAKGLEFKAVMVVGCSEGTMPSPAAFRGLKDPQDQEAAESRERRLLYVAMTRARDELAVSWAGEPSRFLAPLMAEKGS